VYGSWIVEYSSYAFVWLSFVGAPYVRKLGAHIKIEILYATVEPKLSPAVRLIIWLIKEIAVIAYLLLLVRLGYELASRSANFRSQAMQLSQFWLYISAALGGAMFLIREIPGAYQQFRKGFSEPTTHILVDPTL
jgi:TRAP-type C4-dicarboxylate transport system permease small subunit